MRTLRGDWWSVPRFQLRALRRSTFVEVFRQKKARRPEHGRVSDSRYIFGVIWCVSSVRLLTASFCGD